ncbi:MAG TPA: hypothetical protein DDW65_09715 [Firmicutes bacterium]|nr:hypothetical protein [Bacillota bacterium]
MGKTLFFPLFLLIALILTLIYIPRQQYKKYLIYAAITGGMGNMLLTLIMRLLGLWSYTKIGVFNVFGFNYLEPFAWTFVQMIFLYFLPVRKWFLYAYVLGFTGLSVGFAYVIKNLGIIAEFNPTLTQFMSPLIFLAWWSGTAWFYRKIEGMNQNQEKIT